jgi:uncharacterized repeat protein (TIGR03803 family)
MTSASQHDHETQSGSFRGPASWAILLTVLFVWTLAVAPAKAENFKVLYSFKGEGDGESPGGLLLDAKGNLFGLTEFTYGMQSGHGVFFKLDKKGKQTVLYTFQGGPDGDGPYYQILLRDAADNFYGTTVGGGADGLGTVFKINFKSHTKTVLHSFTGGITDGSYPFAGVIQDEAGNLYGTTENGASDGGAGWGGVFKVDRAGTETLLLSFSGSGVGGDSRAGLIWDEQGNLYSTTIDLGNQGCSCGTIFELDSTGKPSVLHDFSGYPTDGANPYTGLIRDPSGNLYGTTVNGGGQDSCHPTCGTVFELSPPTQGGNWTETVLHTFTGGTDGEYPYGWLVRDKMGNLYGTTQLGGAFDRGTVFKIDTAGAETIIHNFDGRGGQQPMAGLVLDSSGNLYGTTSQGGKYDFGAVFKLTP